LPAASLRIINLPKGQLSNRYKGLGGSPLGNEGYQWAWEVFDETKRKRLLREKGVRFVGKRFPPAPEEKKRAGKKCSWNMKVVCKLEKGYCVKACGKKEN